MEEVAVPSDTNDTDLDNHAELVRARIVAAPVAGEIVVRAAHELAVIEPGFDVDRHRARVEHLRQQASSGY